MRDLDSGSPMNSLMKKLKCSKSLVIKWEREKKIRLKKDLIQIEEASEEMYKQSLKDVIFEMDMKNVMELEARNLILLKIEKETWRQKRRAIWLEKGDLNTKLFQSYVENKRVNNSIWEFKGSNGQVVTSHGLLKGEAKNHFQDIFKEPRNLAIFNQLRIIRNYTNFLTNEERL